jgi:2-phospho-L-lactate guanylyltransferase (CobY/MobA/RfbA family)
MTLWAIVPVKPLRRGKSRLADVLSQDERTNLNRHLLENTWWSAGIRRLWR